MAWWKPVWLIAKVTILPYIAEVIWNKFSKRNPDLADLIKETVDAIKRDTPSISSESLEYKAIAEICRDHTYYDRRDVRKYVKKYVSKTA
jgi:hypothetical protein